MQVVLKKIVKRLFIGQKTRFIKKYEKSNLKSIKKCYFVA